MWTDRQTDGQTDMMKLIVALCHSANMHKFFSAVIKLTELGQLSQYSVCIVGWMVEHQDSHSARVKSFPVHHCTHISSGAHPAS